MIYLIIGLFLIFSAVSSPRGQHFKKNLIIVFLFFSLNNFNGFDWINYYDAYLDIELAHSFTADNLFETGSPGFLAILIAAKMLGSYSWVFIFSSVFFIIAVLKWSKNFQNKNLLLALIYCFVGYYYYIERVKQGFALSAIILCLYYMECAKPRRAFGAVLVGILFHTSAVFALALLIFPQKDGKPDKWHLYRCAGIVVGFSAALYLIMSPAVLGLLPGFLSYYADSYSRQIAETFNIAFFWSLGGLSFVIVLFVLYKMARVRPRTTVKNYAFLTYLFAYATNVYYGFPRLVVYYYPYVIASLTKFYSQNGSRRRIKALILLCAFIQLVRPLATSYYFDSIMNYEILGISSKGPVEMQQIRCNSILTKDAANELALYSCGKNLQ